MTIKDTLEALNFNEYQRVTVRRKVGRKIEYLGGGTISKVISRYGHEEIKYSIISEDCLLIYVE